MEFFLSVELIKGLLSILAIVASIFVITTKNAIISVFNLIILYILVAFYLIYIGMTYLGISYIVVYIGAIAILFLFVIMMIDIEIVEKRNNNYLPLLFLLLGCFFLFLKNIFYDIGLIKMKKFSLPFDFLNDLRENIILKSEVSTLKEQLFNLENNLLVNSVSNKEDVGIYNNIRNDEINDILIENLLIPTSNSLNNINIYQDLDNNNESILSFDFSNIIHNKIDMSNELNNLYAYNMNNNIIEKHSLLIIPNWDTAVNKMTQISAIGDVLYTVYHSYIYLISVLLLLGMVGAIILTADMHQEKRILYIREKDNINDFIALKHKNSGFSILIHLFIIPFFVLKRIIFSKLNCVNINKIIINNIIIKFKYVIHNFKFYYIEKRYYYSSLIKTIISMSSFKNIKFISPFFPVMDNEIIHSEGIVGSLFYFIIFNLIIALLLLFINSYFSLSIKYLDKGGGFECGFTSFVQTRERFNVIFYRVSLLFLIFDLEIILAFPYPAIYQKNQNISKNNILAFLYILIIAFVYELKEGALNIVKKAHSTETYLDK